MNDYDQPSGPSHFRTTAWSIVAGAQDETAQNREDCLAALCKNYWKPVYHYIRRRRFRHDDALDMAQEYFATFLEKNFVEAADRERGKFRTFVLVTLNRFLTKQIIRRERQPGAERRAVPIEENELDNVLPELAQDETAEDDFNHRWALSILDSAKTRMEEECHDGKRLLYYQVFSLYLETIGDSDSMSYREIGERLGISESDVTNYLHRGRNIFQKLLRDVIRQSVMTERDVDEEIEALKRYLAR